MRSIKGLFVIIILFSFNKLSAADGCLIGSNIYTQHDNGAINVSLFSSLELFNSVHANTNNCISGVTRGDCYSCVSGGSPLLVVSVGSLLTGITCANGLSLYGATKGTYYSNYVLQCNLDDYSWALGSAAGVFGFVLLRRRKIL
ncbi:hypothetical protein [Pedobacter aquatilis]|uniref:hypothetical protein n=1 Tax=Pedobacter aquatilis TaxID=351343 RepID=UPI00292E2BD4|nr:hypothetical protein [Pedobacter aquatilis]